MTNSSNFFRCDFVKECPFGGCMLAGFTANSISNSLIISLDKSNVCGALFACAFAFYFNGVQRFVYGDVADIRKPCTIYFVSSSQSYLSNYSYPYS